MQFSAAARSTRRHAVARHAHGSWEGKNKNKVNDLIENSRCMQRVRCLA
jgi:hypothetical protein